MSEADQLERFAVSAQSENETKTIVQAREFDFVVDEPAALGGTNDGPNPVEYLIGAWAGCLNVVVHTVSRERGIDIEDVEIGIHGDLDPRKFLGTAEAARAGYQHLDVTIEVESPADEDTLNALGTAVEQRCPVGDTIGNPTPTNVHIGSIDK